MAPAGNLDDKTSEAILDLLWKMRADTGATLVMVRVINNSL